MLAASKKSFNFTHKQSIENENYQFPTQSDFKNSYNKNNIFSDNQKKMDFIRKLEANSETNNPLVSRTNLIQIQGNYTEKNLNIDREENITMLDPIKI